MEKGDMVKIVRDFLPAKLGMVTEIHEKYISVKHDNFKSELFKKDQIEEVDGLNEILNN